jgi:hypothetical protein
MPGDSGGHVAAGVDRPALKSHRQQRRRNMYSDSGPKSAYQLGSYTQGASRLARLHSDGAPDDHQLVASAVAGARTRTASHLLDVAVDTLNLQRLLYATPCSCDCRRCCNSCACSKQVPASLAHLVIVQRSIDKEKYYVHVVDST